MTPTQALDLAIFALNTMIEPQASSAEDMATLDREAETAVAALSRLRSALTVLASARVHLAAWADELPTAVEETDHALWAVGEVERAVGRVLGEVVQTDDGAPARRVPYSGAFEVSRTAIPYPQHCDIQSARYWAVHLHGGDTPDDVMGVAESLLVGDSLAHTALTGDWIGGDCWAEWGEPFKDADIGVALHLYFTAPNAESAIEIGKTIGAIRDSEITVSTAGDWSQQIGGHEHAESIAGRLDVETVVAILGTLNPDETDMGDPTWAPETQELIRRARAWREGNES